MEQSLSLVVLIYEIEWPVKSVRSGFEKQIVKLPQDEYHGNPGSYDPKVRKICYVNPLGGVLGSLFEDYGTEPDNF
jgi:hypothetical protein